MNTLCLAADYESARAIGPWLQELLVALQSTQRDRAGELELAIHEVAINIVDHAFGGENADRQYTISLGAVAGSDDITVELRDDGLPFATAAPPDLDTPQIGGYGLFIAEQLTSSLSYERVDDTNIWTLIFAPTTPDTHPQENNS